MYTRKTSCRAVSQPVHLRSVCFVSLLSLFAAWLAACVPTPSPTPVTPPPTTISPPTSSPPTSPPPTSPPSPITSDKYWIIGSLSVNPAATVALNAIYIPGIKVRLVDSAGTDVATTKTDLSGHFRFAGLLPGRYQVCWEALNFVSSCAAVEIVDENLFLGSFAIKAKSGNESVNLFGKVRFSDNSVPRTLEPFANVNAFAMVEAFDMHIYVNDYGDYFMPAVPSIVGKSTLHTTIEKLAQDTDINVTAPQNGFLQVDINLPNYPPRITGLVAQTPDGRKWTGNPGDKVELSATATDKDGDPVQFRWVIPDGYGSLSSEIGDSVAWTLPDFETSAEVTVVAFDQKGGYAKQSITFSTVPELIFSGKIDANDASAVAGAQVEIGGATATTDASGFFYMKVPEKDRYVLSIRAEGYGLVSQIYDGAVYGGHWTLKRGTTQVVDPMKDIVVVDVNHKNCQGALTDRINWRQQFPKTTQYIEFRDPTGNVLKEQMNPENGLVLPTNPENPPKDRDCGPGMQVSIPANSLVDADGNKPAAGTMLSITLTTIDLAAPDSMPGDYTVLAATGVTMVMQSFGAGEIIVTDGAQRYNLAPGATAEVILPIPPEHLASGGPIPNEIPILYYNETTGIWEEDASLVGQRVGDAYVVKTAHFSTVNADQLKTNQSCIRIDSPIMPSSYKLQISIPQLNGPPVVKTATIDNGTTRFHVIYNLPTNTDITLVPFEVGTNTPIQILSIADFAATGVRNPVTSVAVSSGGPQSPTTPNQPAFPYTACASAVELIQYSPAPPASQLFLSRFDFALNIDLLNPADPAQNTLRNALLTGLNQYYATIDPGGNRENLSEFISFNGFGVPDEIKAAYSNSGDLGFGREMHCVRKTVVGLPGFDVACYVSNFGNRFTADAVDVEKAAHNLTAPGSETIVATVAMEYSRVEDGVGGFLFGGARVVKFYVYPGNNPANPRVSNADLDGSGARPVPQLCIICHGGSFVSPAATGGGTVTLFDATNVNVNAHFLPFDLQAFGFVSDGTLDFPTLTKANQQDDFRHLNQDIVAQTEPGTAISEIITKMYAGGATTQDENFVVDGWNSNSETQTVYRDVIGPSCRTCHTALGNSNIDWRESSEVFNLGGFIASYVCQLHVMPHSVVTHNRFWLSVGPHQPLALHDFLNGASAPGTGIGAICVP